MVNMGTDLRLLFEVLAVRKDKEAMEGLFVQEKFAHISAETAKTIAIMTDNARILERLEPYGAEEEVSMCQAWDEIQQEWEEKVLKAGQAGKEEGIRALILDNLEEGKSREAIIDKLIRRFALGQGAAEEYFDLYASTS